MGEGSPPVNDAYDFALSTTAKAAQRKTKLQIRRKGEKEMSARRQVGNGQNEVGEERLIGREK